MSRCAPNSSPVALLSGGGLITPLAGTLEDNWQALCAGRTLSDHCRIPTDEPITIGRALHWAKLAAQQAVEQSGWDRDILSDDQTALVVGTSKGSIEQWITPPSQFTNCRGLADVAAQISSDLGIAGPRFTYSAACASGLHALIHAAMLIQSRQASRVLVVAVESSIHPLFLGSFARLRVLSTAGRGCRPFDQRRDGFLMSEAAAAVCLEGVFNHLTPPSVVNHPHKIPPVIVENFALGGDATHLTGSDPGAVTLGRVLKSVLNHHPIDLIHAHGTGTVLNDAIELRALESVISGLPSTHPPPGLYSHKAAFGHSLGASGLISILINWLCHQRAVIPPNPNTINPIPTHRLRISACQSNQTIRRSLALASGFGGSCAAATLKTIL